MAVKEYEDIKQMSRIKIIKGYITKGLCEPFTKYMINFS